MEKTLVIVKPDGVKKRLIGEVVRRFESQGLSVVAMKMLSMDRAQAEGFYAVHRGKPFYPSLVEFMSSGPSVVMILEGEDAIGKVREIMGATDPKKAKKGTIRADFASDIEKNIVHGSDSPDSAIFEISYFFPDHGKNG